MDNIEFRPKGTKEFKELTEFDLNSIYIRFIKKDWDCTIVMLGRIIQSDFSPKFNPLEDYPENLDRDIGDTDYIDLIAKTVKTTNDEYFSWCFKKWFVGMVVCMIDPSFTNQTVLVLAGKQNVGKSRFIEKLVPKELNNYFDSKTLNLRNKDTLLLLSQMFLICMDEFSNRKVGQVDELKEIITKKEIMLRNMRKHSSKKYMRRASFAATVNEIDFLTDPTGSRRFLCNEILEADNDSPIELDKAYAQALNLIEDGFDYIFRTEDVKKIHAKNKEYQFTSAIEELFFKHYRIPIENDEISYKTNTEILEKLSLEYKLQVNDSNKKKLGALLRKHGFRRLSRKGRRVYEVTQISFEEQQNIERSLPDCKQKEFDKNLRKIIKTR